MAKTPSRTRSPSKRKPHEQSKPCAPVLALNPKKPVKLVVESAERIKQLASLGEITGIAGVFLMSGNAPIVNSFGITPEQRYQTIGALMGLIRHLQEREK